MKVLVFGKTGQVASELRRLDGVICLGRDAVDLTDPKACRAAIDTCDAEAVINAAAYTAVDEAESARDLAMCVNATAPAAMAAAAAARRMPFVHISTDYVFDGSGEQPKQPDDATHPLGVYGASKRDGEEGVIRARGCHVILRTSWVFSAHGQNFVKKMLRVGAERDRLSIVSDQIGGPTAARDIATACMTIARRLRETPDTSGIYHFSGAPDISRAGFAREILAQAGLQAEIEDILTTDYLTAAARPLNSRLDCSHTETVFGLKRPDWRAGLAQVLSDLNSP